MHSLLPGQKINRHSQPVIDWRKVIGLATPLVANSAIQAALNLTDTWFVGRLSTQALAAMAAIHWLVIVFIALLGGIGMAVQTLVAQAYGARRYARAAQATWSALWAALLTAPLFALIAFNGQRLLAPFELDSEIVSLAMEFWRPRLLGAPLGVALWAILGFFNGIGQGTTTFSVNLVTLVLNAVLAQLFIFGFEFGIAGAAWATNCATAVGLAIAMIQFVRGIKSRHFRVHLTWRLRWHRLAAQFKLGLPMGMMLAADLFGFTLFQLMQVKLSAADGAATQIVMMLTSIAYMPAIGIAIAGTTLVGQSIGAGDKAWARHLGNRIILCAMGYMGAIGLLLGLNGPWLLPLFVNAYDPHAQEVIRIGVIVLWLAGAYQLFDGMTLGASFCLRGAGDAFVPALLLSALAWFFFVPLAHALTFAPGQGWLNFLPQFGYGAVGGWSAAVIYVCVVGATMTLRWRSRAWERLQLG